MQRFRPSFEDGDELLGAGDGIITVLVEYPAFGLLGGAELFGQLIDKVIIESNTSLRFRLKNGLELREGIERTVR